MSQLAIDDEIINKNVNRRLHFELVNILFNQIKNMLWAEIFAATLILFVLFWNGGYESKTSFVIWYICMVFFTGIPRFLLASAYKNATTEQRHQKYWETTLIFLLLISGIGWSIAGTLLLPNNTLNEALVLFLLVGVAAAANPFYSPLKRGYVVFLVPILFITALFLIAKGTNFYIFTGLGLLSFGMLMLITSVISSGLIANSLRLNFRNYALTRNLIRTNKALERLATIDMLTGLPNRQFFSEKLQQTIAEAQTTGDSFALMFLDLDKFKTVNDTLGHDAGDQLLKIVAKRLKKNLREEDILGRLGGDEFLIIIKDVSDRHAIAEFAEKITQSFVPPITISDQTFHLTTSIGIAIFPINGADSHALIKNADTAMYQSKQASNGGYQFI